MAYLLQYVPREEWHALKPEFPLAERCECCDKALDAKGYCSTPCIADEQPKFNWTWVHCHRAQDCPCRTAN